MNQKVRLILQARLIPNGATVTKKSGTSQYTLAREIPIWFNNRSPAECVPFKAEDGTVFLVYRSGQSVSVHNDVTEFAWELTIPELAAWVEEQQLKEAVGNK